MLRPGQRSRFYGPLLMSAALFFLFWLLQENPPRPGRYRDTVDTLFREDLRVLLFLAFIPLIFLAVRIIDALLFDVAMLRRQKVATPQLLRDIVAIALYFVLFGTAITAIFRYNVVTVLTTGTVIAAILGLALQDTLGNLFSGIALHMEDSYEVGDVLRSGDHIGVVEGLSWRATRIRTFNNNLVILPNSVIARDRIEVFPRNNLSALVVSITAGSGLPPAKVIEVLTAAASEVDGVAGEVPPAVRVASFAGESVVYEIKYFTRDYASRERIDADIRKASWYAMNAIATPAGADSASHAS